MNSTRLCASRSVFAFACLLAGVFAHAATVSGTVSNKTTGKPSAGDSVVLVDVGAGMSEAATATTDKNGHYSMQSPGTGAYLVRVNHQGATYFIAAPGGNTPGDVTVYDVSPKVSGVSIDADMMLVEGGGGSLRIQERFLIRNSSLPPMAQFSDKTFEITLPTDAELDGASVTRPGGIGTNTRLVPLSKGHYTFNTPIQPDQGEKETVFEVQYHLPYKGKYTFSHGVPMQADNLVIYVPKGMTFAAGSGADFGPTNEDPRVQTYIHKNVKPGQTVSFSVSGDGSMPRDQQPQQRPAMGGAAGAMGLGGDQSATPAPGGGIGQPINTPDPLTRYKWWILSILALLLIGGAYFMLRKQNPLLAGLPGGMKAEGDADSFVAAPVARVQTQTGPAAYASSATAQPRSSAAPAGNANANLLSNLKDELFAIETERLAGTLSEAEYAEAKAGLEAVLKRALKRQ